MLKGLARLSSYVFHPALIPTWTVVILLNLDTYLYYAVNKPMKWFIYSVVFANTYLFPVAIVLFLYYRKLISDLHLANRNDRVYPYFFSMVFLSLRLPVIA
jgi:hypothetical protein